MKEQLNPELVSALLGVFAHDLRNPLSALHSNVSFLSSILATEDAEAREALDDVAASSDALGHITDNLELFALALDGARPRETLELMLRELLREVAQKTRRFAESYRVVLEIDAESAGDVRVIAHREMLQRAISNLVRNGIQQAGEAGKVTVKARREGSQAIVSVTDTGAPINADLTTLALTAEGQFATKNQPGSRYSRGLGLYAAKIAADVAGATVTVKSGGSGAFELGVKTR